MTYCVALKLEQGLVLASDSRTNAGVDHIASFRKMHVFDDAEDRVLFIQVAGNLATTQSVINILRRDIEHAERHILNVDSLFAVCECVGKVVRDVIARDSGQKQGVSFLSNLLVSGQIEGEEHRLFHVYPEGNFIEATRDTPYFQIGESKYGKPILDRVIDYDITLEKGLQCALLSMDSTLRSNISVGMPIDVMLYRRGKLNAKDILRIDESNEDFARLRLAWSEGLKGVFEKLPIFFNIL